MSSATSSRDRSVGPLTLVARLWWRSTRGVLVGAAVAAVLGVGTWAAVDRLGDAAQVALRRAAAGGALPAVVVGGLDGAASPLAPELLRAPVRAALARCIGRAQVRHGETGIEVLVLGLELAKEAMARPQRFSGTFAPVSAGRSKLLLDASTAAKLAVAPGDDLVLLGRRRVPVTLVALLDPHGSQRIVQGVAVVELTAAQRAFARDDIDQLELLLAPTADPPAEARRIAAVLPTGAVARPVDRRVADGAAEALQMTWRMGGWIALAFACMALLAAVQELVRASARQRGLLRALGASPGLLRAIALGPSAAFCVFAVAAGLSLGELLAPWLRAGCESWVELQTGVTVRLDAGIRAWPAWLGALALAATFGGLVAQWFAAPRWVVRAGRGAERSVEARRLVFAGVAFAVALACAHTGVVQASRWLRVLDLLAGVAAVAFAAPPMVAILARGFARSGRAAAVLAAARLRHRPDGLVGAARLLAVAAAITIALLCVGGSLEGARADIVRARVPGDVLVTDVPTWLGFAADPAGLHAALLADPAVQSAGGTAHSGWIGVDLRSGNGG
ncbi:MAG TPA: FtsX-like permease family protein, partial [bacterium]|nr:FtsX-like permease family protein [bacterium]